MIAQLRGKLIEKLPSQVIIECGGVGYEVQISLNTFNKIGNEEECKLLIHYSVSIDVRSGASNHQLFGFVSSTERDFFRLLISISGVSSNIARTILSFLSPEELQKAVLMGDVNRLKSVKGIGPKLAQRIIAEMQEKNGKSEVIFDNLAAPHNTAKSEALIALCSLGFDRLKADQALIKAMQENGEELAVEELIKYALRLM
jgi:Holliday junction DNA helicase RuvA